RLASVKSTRQITSAMKMVSAAKLRRAQDATIQMRPYANKLLEILQDLSRITVEELNSPYIVTREVKKVLMIVISSNKGLCGAFNSNVSKKTHNYITEEYGTLHKRGDLDIIACGKKAAELLGILGYEIKEKHHDILDHITYDQVNALAKETMKAFRSGVYDEVKIVYNQFKNAVVQELVVEPFLPVRQPEEEESPYNNHLNYIFEPSKEYIIRELIPKSLKMQMYKAFLDSIASEHGARMTAMHKATDNATQLIKDLQLEYNKARQASITTEILEIVGGANALKSQ
ncbi:MAG: ATP synthase F1 subunit gamma, partial [Bacteroidales bacterium]